MTFYSYLSTFELDNNTTFTGKGAIQAYGIGFWSIKGTSRISVPFSLDSRNSDIGRFLNIISNGTLSIPNFSLQGFIGKDSSSSLIFDDNVSLENSGIGFKNMNPLFNKNITLQKSVLCLFNSTSGIKESFVLRNSIFIPIILGSTSTSEILRSKKVEWYDKTNQTNVYSSTLFNSSSILPIFIPLDQNFYPDTPFKIVFSEQNMINVPSVLNSSIGGSLVEPKIDKNNVLLKISRCSGKDLQNSCSCKTFSAPLGSYSCESGVWRISDDVGENFTLLNLYLFNFINFLIFNFFNFFFFKFF